MIRPEQVDELKKLANEFELIEDTIRMDKQLSAIDILVHGMRLGIDVEWKAAVIRKPLKKVVKINLEDLGL